MIDDMFDFIDLIFDTAHDSFSDFIISLDAFFDDLKEKGELSEMIKRPLSEETYKEMWMLRCQQHLGKLSFLKLLDSHEEIVRHPHHTESK